MDFGFHVSTQPQADSHPHIHTSHVHITKIGGWGTAGYLTNSGHDFYEGTKLHMIFNPRIFVLPLYCFHTSVQQYPVKYQGMKECKSNPEWICAVNEILNTYLSRH